MQHLFVVTNSAYAAKIGGGTIASATEAHLLDKGSIAFFDMNGVLMTTSTTLTGQNKFWAALGQGTGLDGTQLEPKVSVVIPRDIYSLAKKAAVTPVAQVDTIGADGTAGAANLPSSPVVGTLAGILIVDTSLPVNNIVLPKYRYEYAVKYGDAAAAVLDGLIALINADPTAIVTATAHQNTGVTDGIVLTAKVVNKSFKTSVGETGPNDILGSATIQTAGAGGSTALVYGFGQPSDVLALEQIYSTTDGNTNQTWLPQYYWTKPTLVSAGDTYKLDTLMFPLNHENAIDKVHATTQSLILALKTGTTQLTSVETILGILFSATTVV
ncbi:MAG: hypothetical protein JST04_01065 [Bdellovibrionales bacterium]|nr:hypothetical protein [Bdellovibrionales bacterium]